MMKNVPKWIALTACIAVMAGCAHHCQEGSSQNKSVAIPSSDNHSATVSHSSSGKMESSGVTVEKFGPTQVLAGRPFEYGYRISNLTDNPLENVTLRDRITPNFTATDSDPKAGEIKDGSATWNLGSLGAKESKTITVKGSATDEGVITSCASISYTPTICQDIHVLKANIALSKTAPADVSVCDPIPTALTVKNTGSSALTGVQIVDTLPAGETVDGKNTITYEVGNLAIGESKTYNYNGAASATGKLENSATVTSTESATATATAATTVHQPVLAITCKAQEQQYLGRKFSVTYTVSNTGDAAAVGTKLKVAVPAGVTVADAGNGTAANGVITYDLGSVDAGNPQTVTATFVSTAIATYEFSGTAKGDCAGAVTTACRSRVVGVPAILLEKADDPDPVAVGDTTTYTVKVTNQGSADAHNVQVVVTIPAELAPESASEGTIDGQTVTLPTVPTLGPKQVLTYKIVAKGVKAGDGHTVFTLSSDVLSSPIKSEESTHVY